MKIPDVHTRKLDDRSKAVINLGKKAGMKAYMLYDPDTRTVLVSRDVTFDEEKPWVWEDQHVEVSKTGSIFNIASMSPDLEEDLEREQEAVMTPVQTREAEIQ